MDVRGMISQNHMNYISLGVIVASIFIIILVALQDRSSGVGGAFGSSDTGGFYQRRRGVERFLFGFTVACLVVFMGLSLLNITRFSPKPAPVAAPQEIPEIGDIQIETTSPDGTKNTDVIIEPVPVE